MRKFISYIIVDLNMIKREISDSNYRQIPFICDNALDLARKALAELDALPPNKPLDRDG
jgi:hypothetical protein